MKGIIAQNSIVKQVETRIIAQLPDAIRKNVEKIVIAGLKYAMKDGAAGLLGHLKGSQDPVSDIVKGVIAIIGLLRKAARGAMPQNAMIPAAFILVMQGLDFAERAGILKVTNEEVKQATRLFADTLLPHLGVTPEKMGQMAQTATQIMNDPMKAGQMQAALGQMGGQ